MPVVVWLTGLSSFLQGPIRISICGCDAIFLMRMLCTSAGMVCFPIQNILAMEYLLNFCFCFDCSTSSKDLVVYRVCTEEVGHGPKGIMVGRISESRTLFYRDHEINMAGF